MANSAEWYVRTEDGKVYGPADLATLVAWAEDGRVEPTGFVSQDRRSWTPSQLLGELQMKWLIEIEPGKVFGPFNRAFAIKLFQSGSVPAGAKAYRLHELAIDRDPEPVIVEKVVEKIVEVEPPARTELVVPEVVEANGRQPPSRPLGGIFKHVDRAHLEVLESAARRELAAAKDRGHFGIFGRKQ